MKNPHSMVCQWCGRTGFNRPQGRAAHERMCAENPANNPRTVAPEIAATFGTVRKPNGHAAALPAAESPHGPVITASSARTITASQGLTTLITELRLKREFIAKQLAAEVEARTALTAKIDVLERECGDCEREIGVLEATLNSLTGSRLGDAVVVVPVSAPAVDVVPSAPALDTIPCSPVADVMPPAPLPGQ